jgi:predicted nucleotide-binding protein
MTDPSGPNRAAGHPTPQALVEEWSILERAIKRVTDMLEADHAPKGLIDVYWYYRTRAERAGTQLRAQSLTAVPATELERAYGQIRNANSALHRMLSDGQSGAPSWSDSDRYSDAGPEVEGALGVLKNLAAVATRSADSTMAAQLAHPGVPVPGPARRRVFVVHGHDTGRKEMVARFLAQLDLEPVILHEMWSGGRTVIEKLEHYSDVCYAVVILSPDDVGGVAADRRAPSKLRPRARQNVVLEFGLFLAKLGRTHVCALHAGDVELPSDMAGVVYIPMDPAGAWRLELAREMSGAGLDVDFRKLGPRV